MSSLIFSSKGVVVFLIFINFFEALDRAKHFSRQRFSSQHRRRDTSISPVPPSGHPVARRQEAKRKNSPLLPPHRSPQFFSDRPSLLPSSHPLRAVIRLLTQHLLSAAIFRIRYLRSQLQISRIPRAEVPLDRTLSDTTRSLFLIDLSRTPRTLLSIAFSTLRFPLGCRR